MTVTILFVASNPASAARLQLDTEAREIEQKLDGATHRDGFQFFSIWAATTDSLLQALNKRRPDIVHFSGHGESSGIVLVDRHDTAQPISGPALGRLFSAFSHHVRLVVLNACHSQDQCDEITAIVGCTIGSRAAIGDDNAILFSSSFYRALAFGESVANAHAQGIAAIHLGRQSAAASALNRDMETHVAATLSDDDFPPPFHRTDVDPATLRFVAAVNRRPRRIFRYVLLAVTVTAVLAALAVAAWFWPRQSDEPSSTLSWREELDATPHFGPEGGVETIAGHRRVVATMIKSSGHSLVEKWNQVVSPRSTRLHQRCSRLRLPSDISRVIGM